MIRHITVPAIECTCDKCGYTWVTLKGKPPQNCQNKNCGIRAWNGRKREKKPHTEEIKFPAPRLSGRPKTNVFIDYSEDP